MMGCPACGELLEVEEHELADLASPVQCPACRNWTPVAELLIGRRHSDPDDAEQDHDGPYFWNR